MRWLALLETQRILIDESVGEIWVPLDHVLNSCFEVFHIDTIGRELVLVIDEAVDGIDEVDVAELVDVRGVVLGKEDEDVSWVDSQINVTQVVDLRWDVVSNRMSHHHL